MFLAASGTSPYSGRVLWGDTSVLSVVVGEEAGGGESLSIMFGPSKFPEEEEESHSPLKGGKKKRGASADLEAEASKKGRISLTDDSESDADEWRPRPKPLAGS